MPQQPQQPQETVAEHAWRLHQEAVQRELAALRERDARGYAPPPGSSRASR